jgi:hypothetical protein
MAGIPPGAIMAAAGHHSLEMHNSYVNLNETHLKKAFEMFPTCSQGIAQEVGGGRQHVETIAERWPSPAEGA